ncbi:TonB-dependent receptor [Roseivirga pacifica]|uniref:TonB-dependent receptor n=1 Tax=Roseivirga pacifica TaxID=1267423 RepID=UPI003BAEF760
MNKNFLMATLLCLLSTSLAYGQNTISFKILDAESKEPMVGATVYAGENKGAIADIDGIATIAGITESTIKVRISFVGYEAQELSFSFPLTESLPIEVLLGHHDEEMEDVVVTATRTSRSIEDIPTRVEFLGAEELQEKAVMRSANIAMLLRESTGIQMQITSPSSANQSIRIQGLDGRYTQLMKDGFPLYGGFSGGLSIMQIPPLDLQQVEVIKGSNSTLYGGGAIAGLVNLVSIRPSEDPLTKIMLDQTSAGGTTLNAFHATQKGKWGYSLFGSGHLQKAYDPNDDNFSDLPEVESITINPTIYYSPNQSSQFRLGLNGTFENRLGGNLDAIDRGTPSDTEYLQENRTRRMSYQLSYTNDFGGENKLTIKNSLLHFDRDIGEYQYGFDGEQIATFSEATYSFGSTKSNWLVGANLYTDRFREGDESMEDRSYNQLTGGVFVNQTANLSERFVLESGMRLDMSKDYGVFALPRASLLYKANAKLSYRIGGGLGYKLPTIFTEDSERLSFRGINSFNLTDLDAEKSYGGNFDVNYKTAIGSEWTFSINQMIFYTQLTDPLVLRPTTVADEFAFENADGPMRTQGLETNLKLTYKDFKLFLNYALIDTELQYENINNQKPLTAKHNAGAVLVYEQHGKWRIGLEAYYTGQQFRENYTETDDYWIAGLMMLRKFNKISVYLNFENFTDTRQSRFESIDLGNSTNPAALDIWAPMDGFIANGGVILEF